MKLFSHFLISSWDTRLKNQDLVFRCPAILLTAIHCFETYFLASWRTLATYLLSFVILIVSSNLERDNSVFLVSCHFVLRKSFKLLLRLKVWLMKVGSPRLTLIFRTQHHRQLLIIFISDFNTILILDSCIYLGLSLIHI